MLLSSATTLLAILIAVQLIPVSHCKQLQLELKQQPAASELNNGNSSQNDKNEMEKKFSNDLPEEKLAIEDQVKIPVIGILTQVLRDYKRFVATKHLHLVASYVKWIEATGAQVLPIELNQNDSYYESVFKKTNGLLFPGGDNILDPDKCTPMMRAAKKLYKLAVEANDVGNYYPIWGTCLGFELLSVLTSNRNVLSLCSANDIGLPVQFNQRFSSSSKMFAPRDFPGLETGIDYSKLVERAMESSNSTYNYHHFCLNDQDLAQANLSSFYRPLAYSIDVNGLKFISIMESIKYPFYGVQFHPEKPAFEFTTTKSQMNIPHSLEAMEVSRYLANFFVSEARLNKNRISRREVQDLLIYSHKPMYTAVLNDIYEQRYLFPYKSIENCSDEEFLDHVPSDDEVVPELVTLPPLVQQ